MQRRRGDLSPVVRYLPAAISRYLAVCPPIPSQALRNHAVKRLKITNIDHNNNGTVTQRVLQNLDKTYLRITAYST